jgi:Ca2+-binding RTX toxin-like protein
MVICEKGKSSMKFTARKSVNMRTEISFFEAYEDDVVSAGSKKIVLRDPFGNKQEYLGKFSYRNGQLNWRSSELTGFKQYQRTTLYWSAESLSISGSKYNEFAVFDDGAGLLRYALRGNDTITGSNQSDVLLGGAGRDVITGRGGADRLSGGKGADRFVYNAVSDSKTGVKNRDTITDFNRSEGDKIDLSKIDADPKRRGNQKLSFIGSKQFTGKAGEVRFSGGILEVDTNWDKKSDMQIVLSGVKDFQSSSLIL